jgi:hypothetical protein
MSENNETVPANEQFLTMMTICTETLKTDSLLPKLHCEVIFKIMNTIIGILQKKHIEPLESENPSIIMKLFNELDILKPTSFLHNDNNPVFFICKSWVRL